MNALALSARIGRTGKLAVSPSAAHRAAHWLVPVRVIDSREAWGSVQDLVTPTDDEGRGQQSRGPAVWVDASRVTLDPEPRP